MASAVHLEWFDQLPCAVTVCGKDYTILYMNDRSAQVNADDGGKALIGKNLMDCHPPEAQTKLKEVMASGRPNVYTTEREGEEGHLPGSLEEAGTRGRARGDHVRTSPRHAALREDLSARLVHPEIGTLPQVSSRVPLPEGD